MQRNKQWAWKKACIFLLLNLVYIKSSCYLIFRVLYFWFCEDTSSVLKEAKSCCIHDCISNIASLDDTVKRNNIYLHFNFPIVKLFEYFDLGFRWNRFIYCYTGCKFVMWQHCDKRIVLEIWHLTARIDICRKTAMSSIICFNSTLTFELRNFPIRWFLDIFGRL